MAHRIRKPEGRTAYVNARLIDPASNLDVTGGVLTSGEEIADFGAHLGTGDGAPTDATVIDCKGLVLAPGLVDMRVQLREPGEEHKGTLQSAGESAVAGGVTAMVCLPNTNPVIDDMSVVEFVARRARQIGLAKVYPYGAATKGLEGKELAEYGLLLESGAVAFTDGIHAIENAQVMRRALTYASTFDAMIVQHPEEPSLSTGDMNASDTATRLGLSGIPSEAEIIMVERDIRLVKLTGGRLHFAHISTAEAVEAIRKAKAEGLEITCDTAPPYFALNEGAVGDYRTFSKLSPPLRSEQDRLAIIEGLRDGTIDVIASDHAPHDEEAKRLPFHQAAEGGVGLETLLPICLELYQNKQLSLMEILDKLTRAPADITGLPGGHLAKGQPADLVLFDPERGWQVTENALVSKSKNTPFDYRAVQGKVMRTVIDGRTVFNAEG